MTEISPLFVGLTAGGGSSPADDLTCDSAAYKPLLCPLILVAASLSRKWKTELNDGPTQTQQLL